MVQDKLLSCWMGSRDISVPTTSSKNARDRFASLLHDALWQLSQLELQGSELPSASLTIQPMSSNKIVARIAAWRGDFSDAVPSEPIVSVSGVYQAVAGKAVTASLVVDCRGMDADQVLLVWRNWPKATLVNGLSLVLVADRPMHWSLEREGVLLEYFFSSPFQAHPCWSEIEAEKLEFIRRKYGVDRIASGRKFTPP